MVKFENLELEKVGWYKIRKLKIKITMEKDSWLHIGCAEDPLTGKKGAVFKVDGVPIIPASSFKGALRYQMEQIFIKKLKEFKEEFNISNDEVLKPCIPSPKPSKAEKELINRGYRKEIQVGGKRTYGCLINVNEDSIEVPKINNQEVGICPVCYFLGCSGFMGFIRVSNFYPESSENILIEQTNIRLDRSTKTAAPGAIVHGEHVKPGVIFTGTVEVIEECPQGFRFGEVRKIENVVIDKWLEYWDKDLKDKQEYLLNYVLIPAIENIAFLGGQRTRGGGKVKVRLINKN